MVLFIYNFCKVYQPIPYHVHQLETFQDLIESVLACDASNQDVTEYRTDSSLLLDATFTPSEGYNSSSKSVINSTLITICPIDTDRLRYFDNYELDTWLNYRHVQVGGRFSPLGCLARQKVAIIVPYKDQEEHLERFTLYIHQFLPDQLIEYSIFVIQQIDDTPFDKPNLLNIGAAKIRQLSPDIHCFIFHDVDLLPLDQRNLYMCSTMPRHLSVSTSNFRYQLSQPIQLGGVVSTTRNQFEKIGGFCNERSHTCDNDMFKIIETSGYEIERTPKQLGLYMMLKHVQVKSNRNVSLEKSYTIKNVEYKQLFTLISVKFA